MCIVCVRAKIFVFLFFLGSWIHNARYSVQMELRPTIGRHLKRGGTTAISCARAQATTDNHTPIYRQISHNIHLPILSSDFSFRVIVRKYPRYAQKKTYTLQSYLSKESHTHNTISLMIRNSMILSSRVHSFFLSFFHMYFYKIALQFRIQ